MLSIRGLLLLALLLVPLSAYAIGFETERAPDPQGAPIDVGIWYPSDAPATPQRLGPYTQNVSPGGAIRGESLPLVLISHGTGGNFAGHHDTAEALAEAGFVAAALNHPGDTTGDTSLAGTAQGLAERPRQLRIALDYILHDWPGHDRIDPARIGAFGYSAGGFTVLVAAGGEPDLRRVAIHCVTQPSDPSCRLGRAPPGAPAAVTWTHDQRLRAIAAAAPALGYTFVPGGLAGIGVPVQLWRPEADEVLAQPWHAELVDRFLPAVVEYREVPRAGHYAFLAPCPDGMTAAIPEICIDAPGFDRAAFHRSLNEQVVRFFRERLVPR